MPNREVEKSKASGQLKTAERSMTFDANSNDALLSVTIASSSLLVRVCRNKVRLCLCVAEALLLREAILFCRYATSARVRAASA